MICLGTAQARRPQTIFIPMHIPNPPAYLAAQQQAAFRVIPHSGAIRLSGDDRIAFLQRQTTNDLRLLQPERSVTTVLTSPTARILDVLCLLSQADAIIALTLPGYYGEATARYLRSRIFFMDKVVLDDASAELSQVDIIGPEACQTLKKLGLDGELTANQVASIQLGDTPAWIIALEPAAGLGFRLCSPAGAFPQILDALTSAGAARLSEETYHILRLEAGLPAAGAEWVDAYTPLETGLQVAVSDRKGCYTGQEVIARQITYDKVTHRLCGLKSTTPLTVGAKVYGEPGRVIGQITSAAHSPRFGEIALAVLKRPYDQPGQVIQVDEQGQEAVVATLPFA